MAKFTSILITITDAGDSRISAYRSLKGKELEKDGIFIAEGEKVVKSMIDSGLRIASSLVSGDALERYKKLLAVMANRNIPVYVADKRLIESIIGFRFHRGIMAVGYCPAKNKLTDAFRPPKSRILLVALNAINDPQNVGLIVRNAAAFGAQALIVDNATYDPYYRKAVRVSMGTIFTLPVYYEDNLKAGLIRLKKEYKVRIVAAALGKGSIDIGKVKLSGNICLVFGNEDNGISRNILNIADVRARIPISGAVDSLNVASASAVLLHAASGRPFRVDTNGPL